MNDKNKSTVLYLVAVISLALKGITYASSSNHPVDFIIAFYLFVVMTFIELTQTDWWRNAERFLGFIQCLALVIVITIAFPSLGLRPM